MQPPRINALGEHIQYVPFEQLLQVIADGMGYQVHSLRDGTPTVEVVLADGRRFYCYAMEVKGR